MKKLGLLLLVVSTQSFAAQTVIWSNGLFSSRPTFDVNYMFSPSEGSYCYQGQVEDVCPLVETAVNASGYTFAGCTVSDSDVFVMIATDQTVHNAAISSCQ